MVHIVPNTIEKFFFHTFNKSMYIFKITLPLRYIIGTLLSYVHKHPSTSNT